MFILLTFNNEYHSTIGLPHAAGSKWGVQVGGAAVLAKVDQLCALLPLTAGERAPAHGAGGRAFGLTGLDFMVTEDGRIFLLEFNASPAAPPPATVAEEHSEHLVEFAAALVRLVGSAVPDAEDGFTRVGQGHKS